MTRQLEEFKLEIITLIQQHRENRGFDTLLNALLSDINDLSNTRLSSRPIIQRMFDRLNNGRENPYDSRHFSPAFQTFGPISMAQTDLAILIEIMRSQVFVYTADSVNLDDLGRDYDFPRFKASRAIRIGQTWDTQGNLADFPIGSRLATRDTGVPVIFEIFKTGTEAWPGAEIGSVLFRHVPDPNEEFIRGDIGNAYFGDLSPASPINGIGRATITGTYVPGQNHETDEEYRRRFLRFLRRRAFGGNVPQYQAETVRIQGVGDVMVFPVWRGGGTVKLSIVDTERMPVSVEFIDVVKSLTDPVLRSGTGFGVDPNNQMMDLIDRIDDGRINFGIAPIGHRVTVSTPEMMDVFIKVQLVLLPHIEEGQAESIIQDFIRAYIDEVGHSLVNEWERTYYANIGISNAFVGHGNPEWFPAALASQTHNFHLTISRMVIGARLMEVLTPRIVANVDIWRMEINGQQSDLIVPQSQEVQLIPRLYHLDIEYVNEIQPYPQTPDVPVDMVGAKYFNIGFDKPMDKVRILEVDNA